MEMDTKKIAILTESDIQNMRKSKKSRDTFLKFLVDNGVLLLGYDAKLFCHFSEEERQEFQERRIRVIPCTEVTVNIEGYAIKLLLFVKDYLRAERIIACGNIEIDKLFKLLSNNIVYSFVTELTESMTNYEHSKEFKKLLKEHETPLHPESENYKKYLQECKNDKILEMLEFMMHNYSVEGVMITINNQDRVINIENASYCKNLIEEIGEVLLCTQIILPDFPDEDDKEEVTGKLTAEKKAAM